MLKTIALLLILGLLITPSLNSQGQGAWDPCDPNNPDNARPNPEMQRAEIVNLERETARAILLNNGTFFRRVYSEDFSGTLSHGQTVDKIRLINEVQDSGARYQSFTASNTQVRIFQETAVATSLWTSRGTYEGHPIETQMRVMHIYINSPRGWHVVAVKPPPCRRTDRIRCSKFYERRPNGHTRLNFYRQRRIDHARPSGSGPASIWPTTSSDLRLTTAT